MAALETSRNNPISYNMTTSAENVMPSTNNLAPQNAA